MKDINRNPLQRDKFTEKNRLRNHLLICLKYHHHELLEEVPLETAINAMLQAWKDCQSDMNHYPFSGIPTEVNPKVNTPESVARHVHC
ncbi:hypothetical protein [Acaryochloris marina]|uniref:hypothetical protein n=1 Tax=Acaryochloris marina TaxID=155978 RepID=UPI0005A05776|nr:hypothetical protein [Acaryochloris marina]